MRQNEKHDTRDGKENLKTSAIYVIVTRIWWFAQKLLRDRTSYFTKPKALAYLNGQHMPYVWESPTDS